MQSKAAAAAAAAARPALANVPLKENLGVSVREIIIRYALPRPSSATPWKGEPPNLAIQTCMLSWRGVSRDPFRCGR